MTHHSKFVATVLLIGVLVLPTAGEAICSEHMAGMGRQNSHAAMIGMATLPVSFTTVTSRPCCGMFPTENATVPVFQTTVRNAASVVPPLAASTIEVPRTMEYARGPSPTWMQNPPPQSLLCVFLI